MRPRFFAKKRKKHLTKGLGGDSISELSGRDEFRKESERNLRENEKSS